MPKVEIELPEAPEGYEYTGEYRSVKKGETFRRWNGICQKRDEETRWQQ